MKSLAQYFEFSKAGTNFKTETLAGVTTFLAMAYITIVNPVILSDAGMDFGAVFVATCLAAAFGSIAMGLLGNYPIAQAPGMGQNAFFTYGVVLGMGHPWPVALGAVFFSGVIFLILSALPVREWLINSIPRNLKLGISGGIGLFLGIIALENAKIVVDSPATLVKLGDLSQWEPLLCLAGFAIITALAYRKLMGAVVIGMLSVTVIGWLTGIAEFKGVMSLPPSPAPVLFKLDFAGALEVGMVTVIITMLIVDVFDTAGTMVGVANRAGLIQKDGSLPRLGKALLSDSGATTFGALVGTSSTTSYIESAAGVEAGGRTGFTAVVTGIIFLLCLFFSPIAQSVPAYATAAALLFVACLMTRSLADLNWDDHTESAPAIIAAIAMPLGYSIADGIGLGFISYAVIKVLSGRITQCPPVVFVVAGIFALKFFFL
ncbi:NCS2 family permease [Teredinibacter turnerae]|uniref:NCS2 family permease n=1 Tax=Teredinibacter turnerae TaxID=2426 RepID=UPI00036B492A|nr:NCS2 family permease [Teredinibacter turnerae]